MCFLPPALPDAWHVHLVPAENVKLIVIKNVGSVAQNTWKLFLHWPESTKEEWGQTKKASKHSSFFISISPNTVFYIYMLLFSMAKLRKTLHKKSIKPMTPTISQNAWKTDITLAWLGRVCPGWELTCPPGCCWWPAQSCSCTPAGRRAGNLHPNQAAGPWYTTAETPALLRSQDTQHPETHNIHCLLSVKCAAKFFFDIHDCELSSLVFEQITWRLELWEMATGTFHNFLSFYR